MIGRRLNQFRIDARLGKGSMGVVYRATDERLGRQVALKVLPDALAAHPERRARFLREARAAAAATHRNIATIYEIGEADGHVFIAMELGVGETLRERIAAGLSQAEAMRVAKEVARGLAAAHEKGIVHRDLKPENVMLTADGQVKVLDFGVAKLLSTESDPLAAPSDATIPVTAEGRIVGTPPYMSPEQAEGRADVDARSDVFSFGAMFYEMLAGVRPFQGQTNIAVMYAVLHREPEPLASVCPGAPALASETVERCLRKKPEERFASGRDLASLLSTLGDVGSDAASLRVPLARPSTPGAGGTGLGVEAPRPSTARRGLWGAIAALAVAGVLLSAMRGTGARHASAGASASASASSVAYVRMIDLPPPVSSSPEAVAAYVEGVRGWHDGLNAAYKPLDRAVALDPAMAAASLRLAEIYMEADQLVAARSHFRRMMAHLDALSSRDRAVAGALESIVLADPPDWAEGTRRLESIYATNSNDLGVLELLGNARVLEGKLGPARVSLERVTSVDPQAGEAWSMLIRIATAERRTDDARAIAMRCAQQCPSATSCIEGLAALDAAAGRCSAVLDDGRRDIAISPEDGWGYWFVTVALAAMHEPASVVAAAWREESNHRDGSYFDTATVRERAAMNVLEGDFSSATELAAKALVDLAQPQRLYASGRERAYSLRLPAALEQGDLPSAGRLAVEYLLQRRVFATPELNDDPLPAFLAVARRAGLLSHDAARKQMDAWRAEWTTRLAGHPPPELWAVGDAAYAATPDEARAALATRPPLDRLPVDGVLAMRVAHLSFLAERYEEAETLLEAHARDCRVFDDPFGAVQSHLELGVAREHLGKHDAACEAFREVLTRWGHAKPRSVTADAARAGMKRLACAP